MEIRPKNIFEKNLLGEEEIKKLPRDKRGRFVSKKSNQAEQQKEKEEEWEYRDIKLVKVKGSYGTYNVVGKKKLIPKGLSELLIGFIFLFFSISTITKILIQSIIT